VRVGIAQFPGSNCDYDVLHVLRDVIHADTQLAWHTEFKEEQFDAAILPGGFSYGDHLRAGVIAAFSPVMGEIRKMAHEGKPILGICNGFQILVESGLLPGALMQNSSLKFVDKWTNLRVETRRTPFTRLLPNKSIIHLPIAHAEGRFVVDPETLHDLRQNDSIVFSFCDENGEINPEANPNGAMENIAGICNEEGNVMGLMPHPERASESLLTPSGCTDGLLIFQSMLNGGS
jgi:phosphoribosylformylglycinamidine synthase subunit PurQ / glutaminase